MAGRSTARRTETGRSHPARPAARGWAEPVLPVARPGSTDLAEPPGMLTLALSPERVGPAGQAVPAVVIIPEPSSDMAAPDVVIVPPRKLEGEVAAPLPVVETDLSARRCPYPVAARVSLSIAASMLLHAGAAAAFVWLNWTMPPPISAGEEGIPVELVVAAETGAASRQEAASGREETQTPSTDSQAQERIEAPPLDSPPQLAAREAAETPSVEAPAAQPDPMTTADRIADQLPPHPMPDHLPVIDQPAAPLLGDALSEPVRQEHASGPVSAQPVQQQTPAETQSAQTEQAEATEAPPPPAAVVQPARPPLSRREAAIIRERARPSRQVAARPQPERTTPAARQVESRARVAERGEGAGQRNRQQSNATGAAGASSVAAVAAWRQRVLAHLARFKVYPEQARDRGIRGRTGVSFTLSGSGTVTAVSIASSSGAAILDQATLAMVRRAQPFPPNPAGGPATFTAGVNYSLY